MAVNESEKPITDPETSGEAIEEQKEQDSYPSTSIVVPAVAGLYLAVFLVALDRTILGTAIPSISNEFNSFGDVAWHEAGYLLPLCVVLLPFGRIYTYYSAKWILIAQVAIFEIGSIVCATAPNSHALIVGRAVSGIGSAGINSGSLILISQLVPLRSRPSVTGGIGAMFGISSILGPVLGGYLTSVTWRWCFWINVPIGAFSLAVLIFLTPRRRAPCKPENTSWKRLKQLDPIGFILVTPAIVCLLFATQFGGIRYSWKDGRIIALLVLFGVFTVAFIAVDIWRKEKATLPPRIITQRSVLAGSIAALGIGSCIVILPFYLPIWFQVIQGKSSQSSGLSLIPMLLSMVFAVITCGVVTSKVGWYTPFSIVGSAILVVGTGLISTWQVGTSEGIWIGYQIIAGAGLGMSLQTPNVAAQTVCSPKDLPVAIIYLQFMTFLGGSVFVAVCQNLLENKLIQNLSGIVPNLGPSSIANGGATSLRGAVPEDKLDQVLVAYNDSIKSIWYLALGLACLIFVSSFGFEWKNVKEGGNKGDGESQEGQA